MPKIIENLREKLLDETKRQITEYGYAKTTIKSVSSACGVGVGTVYNYFPSKDMLIAGFMAEEWIEALKVMAALPKNEPKTLLFGIYSSLIGFAENNKVLFSDPDAAKVAGASFTSRHKMLREQISEFVFPICENTSFADEKFASEFIAESLICWSMENKDFDTVFGMIEKLLKK